MFILKMNMLQKWARSGLRVRHTFSKTFLYRRYVRSTKQLHWQPQLQEQRRWQWCWGRLPLFLVFELTWCYMVAKQNLGVAWGQGYWGEGGAHFQEHSAFFFFYLRSYYRWECLNVHRSSSHRLSHLWPIWSLPPIATPVLFLISGCTFSMLL